MKTTVLLQECQRLNQFVESHFPYLGKGYTRKCFDLENGWVLKTAMNENGILQNRNEIVLAPYRFPVLCRFYLWDTSDDPLWVVTEKAKPLSARDSRLIHSIHTGIEYVITRRPKYIDKEAKKHPFIPMLWHLKQQGFNLNDISKPDNWGIAADGRVILIDPGLVKQQQKTSR